MDREQVERKMNQEKEELRTFRIQRDASLYCSKDWHRYHRLVETKKRNIKSFEQKLENRYSPGKPYHPSNGSEGTMFEDQFCLKCKKDHELDCEIHTGVLILLPSDPKYPREWTYTADGFPTCTAFDQI